jgi:hypothetical protein
MIPRAWIIAVLIGGLVWLAIFWTIAEKGINPGRELDVVMVTTTLPPATTIALPPPTTTSSTSMPRAHETAPTAGRSISSTAYCESGRMANGEIAHDGAVSSKVLARGTSWRVLSGPFAGRVFIVKDTGSLAFFDIAMPGRCEEAVRYGRRNIQIEAA